VNGGKIPVQTSASEDKLGENSTIYLGSLTKIGPIFAIQKWKNHYTWKLIRGGDPTIIFWRRDEKPKERT
jgi:hypothetical protein